LLKFLLINPLRQKKKCYKLFEIIQNKNTYNIYVFFDKFVIIFSLGFVCDLVSGVKGLSEDRVAQGVAGHLERTGCRFGHLLGLLLELVQVGVDDAPLRHIVLLGWHLFNDLTTGTFNNSLNLKNRLIIIETFEYRNRLKIYF
jgi:hypothetical protein